MQAVLAFAAVAGMIACSRPADEMRPPSPEAGAPGRRDAAAEPTGGPDPGDEPEWPPEQPVSPPFELPPYLTMPAPGRITVSWRTIASTTGVVLFGNSSAEHWRRSALAGPQHHVDLGPLEPGAAYRYEVRVEGTSALRRGVFVVPGRESWRFAHVAELHAPSQSDLAAEFAPHMRAFRPHLIVDSGDMCDWGEDIEHWRWYFRASAAWISNVILLPSQSNHVNGTGGSPTFQELFSLPSNERWYPTRWGQVQFLNLDSVYEINADVATGQVAWLGDEVAQAHDGYDDPVFVVGAWHYPACSSEYLSRLDSRRWVHDYLVRPAVAAGGLDLILVGHDKYYERSFIAGGIVHVQSNIGLLAPEIPGFDHPDCLRLVTRTDTRSLLLVEVDGSRMSARAIDPDGKQLDRFTLQK